MVNNPVTLNDQFNQWLAVDEATGTLGAIYYDTVNDVGRLKTDVYYQTSGNGGATWSTAVKVTTAMSDETAAGADGGNQYGDYNSLSAYAGAFFPSWTDRRSSGSEEIWTAHVAELPAGAFDFYTLPPCRLFDTRLADGPLGGPVLQGNTERVFAAAGACGVPSTAKALLTNVTVVAPTTGGYLQIYSPDGGPPITSVVSFSAGQVLANNAIFGLAKDGTGRVTVKPGLPGTVHVVVDVSGYFQ
jgi:hypothetical protein